MTLQEAAHTALIVFAMLVFAHNLRVFAVSRYFYKRQKVIAVFTVMKPLLLSMYIFSVNGSTLVHQELILAVIGLVCSMFVAKELEACPLSNLEACAHKCELERVREETNAKVR